MTKIRSRKLPRVNGTHRPSRPVVVGTGFVPLDVVIKSDDADRARTWAGGTCGNVMAILSYLGWRAYPFARLGDDAAADRIISDLENVGVETQFIKRDPQGRSPIVTERIGRTAGGLPRSRFIWTCPQCEAWFPGFQPVLARDMESVAPLMPDPAVFFFDRVSRGALDLATAATKRGALVMFEPSGVGDERLFREAVALAHVLKYSRDRLTGLAATKGRSAPLLEVETLGAEGLRYRRRRGSAAGSWRQLRAFNVTGVRDTVGAGDWCSAGLLQTLGREGATGLRKASEADVDLALRNGQALAAVACLFEGARGGMYVMDKHQFQAAIKTVLAGGSPITLAEQRVPPEKGVWRTVCRVCSAGNRRLGASDRVAT